MENTNWEFLVQTGILICLVILVYRSFRVEDSMHAHFDEVHEDAKTHGELLANMPSYHQFYKVMKDR